MLLSILINGKEVLIAKQLMGLIVFVVVVVVAVEAIVVINLY